MATFEVTVAPPVTESAPLIVGAARNVRVEPLPSTVADEVAPRVSLLMLAVEPEAIESVCESLPVRLLT